MCEEGCACAARIWLSCGQLVTGWLTWHARVCPARPTQIKAINDVAESVRNNASRKLLGDAQVSQGSRRLLGDAQVSQGSRRLLGDAQVSQGSRRLQSWLAALHPVRAQSYHGLVPTLANYRADRVAAQRDRCFRKRWCGTAGEAIAKGDR
jgi:hypothetical protein